MQSSCVGSVLNCDRRRVSSTSSSTSTTSESNSSSSDEHDDADDDDDDDDDVPLSSFVSQARNEPCQLLLLCLLMLFASCKFFSGRVLRSGGPCYQDCWHTGLLYASLIGSHPLRPKVKGNDLTCNEPHNLSSCSSVACPKSDANVRLGSIAS